MTIRFSKFTTCTHTIAFLDACTMLSSFSITTLPYLDKDQLGGYTMLSGDIVLFNLAVDRRNGAQRATNVQIHKLIEEQKDQNARETVSLYMYMYIWYL